MISTATKRPNQRTEAETLALTTPPLPFDDVVDVDFALSEDHENTTEEIPPETNYPPETDPPLTPPSPTPNITHKGPQRPNNTPSPSLPPNATVHNNIAWFHKPPDSTSPLGRTTIWERKRTSWHQILIADESAHLHALGIPRQWGLYCAKPGGHQPDTPSAWDLGPYGTSPIHVAQTEHGAMEWAWRHAQTGSQTTMVCRKEEGWHVYDKTSGTGKHLHLINDACGGGIENTKFTKDGRMTVDGYVEEFQPHKPAHEQTAAELLCSYGPHFNLNGNPPQSGESSDANPEDPTPNHLMNRCSLFDPNKIYKPARHTNDVFTHAGTLQRIGHRIKKQKSLRVQQHKETP